MPHVQGASVFGNSQVPGVSVSLTGVGAGNCLILSTTLHEFITLGKGFPIVSDNQGNIWELYAQSPIVMHGSGPQDWSVYTWVALNCIAGDTTVTFQSPTDDSPVSVLLLDEYSGVAAAQAVDKATFNSTPFKSGATSLDSLGITTGAGDLLYSAVYTNLQGNTYTPTAGFTQRQTNGGGGLAQAASFDATSPGGLVSNTVSVSSGVPDTIHVTLISLKASPIARPFIQAACYVNCSVASTHLTTATYPYPNTAGNLLIAVGQMNERLDPVFTDTAGNVWTVVFGNPGDNTCNFCMAYVVGCLGGPNAVTMDTLGGGTDVALNLIIAEYSPVQGFIASSFGSNTGGTVDTGFVATAGPALLVSSFFGDNQTGGFDKQAYVPADNLGTRRFQFSDSGFLNQSARSLALADQTETVPGNYDNIFDISPDSGPLQGIILGFTLPPTPPAPKHKPRVFSVIVPIQRQIAHLVYDTHSGAWYPDQYAGNEIVMHYAVPQRDPAAETFVLKGDTAGNVLVETPNTTDNGTPITCVVGTREANPGGWAYSWFENPGVDLLPTNATALSVQAAALGTVLGVPSSFQGNTRITQGIVDTGGGQPLKSMGLKLTWTQTYSGGEVKPVELYMMQWLAVPYPEPILNQRTKGTSHGLRGFQHLFMGQLAYVSPSGPVTVTLQYDQPGGAGSTATIVLPATAAVGPDPIKQMFKIPPNKWKIVSYDIAADTQFFLWPHDCEMWLKEWGAESEYLIVRPWGGAGEEPIA